MGSVMRRKGSLAGFSLVPILGIFAFRLSAWSVFGGPYIEYSTDAFAYSRVAQFAGILAIVAASLLRPIPRRAQVAVVSVATAAMMLGALLCVRSGPQDTLFYTARIVHGACSAVLIMGWGAYTCSVEPRKAAVYVSVAFALYGVASFVLQGADAALSAAVTVLSPLLSGGVLAFEAARPGRAGFPRAELHPGDLRGLNWAAVVLLFACCIVCSATNVFVASENAGIALYMNNVFRMLVFCLLAAVFCFWAFCLRRDDPDQQWPLFSCVIFFGLLGYSTFSFVNEAASVSFMRATQDCLMLFSWVFVSGVSYRHRLPRLVVFGAGTTLFMRTDLPANILSLAFPQVFAEADPGVAVGLSFAMAAGLIVYTIALLGRSTMGRSTVGGAGENAGEKTGRDGGAVVLAGDSSSAVASSAGKSPDGAGGLAGADDSGGPAGSVGSICTDGDDEFAWLAMYELTGREAQVVGLLLRGYTLPQVGEHFGVSLNTARWYAKNIYRKMGIHSKAELIALAEESADENAPKSGIGTGGVRDNASGKLADIGKKRRNGASDFSISCR